MKRAVLYLRVSTLDPTTTNQERELRQAAGRVFLQLSCEVFLYAEQGRIIVGVVIPLLALSAEHSVCRS
jgi:hypothetical protein